MCLNWKSVLIKKCKSLNPLWIEAFDKCIHVNALNKESVTNQWYLQQLAIHFIRNGVKINSRKDLSLVDVGDARKHLFFLVLFGTNMK